MRSSLVLGMPQLKSLKTVVLRWFVTVIALIYDIITYQGKPDPIPDIFYVWEVDGCDHPSIQALGSMGAKHKNGWNMSEYI